MDLARILAGRAPPEEINVIVEIPQGGPIKYEYDAASGALFVDRFLGTAMVYPGNYGFVPHTLAPDGDPLDVLVIGAGPVQPGAVVRCRPLGVLLMADDHGKDDKIVAAPLDLPEVGLTPAMRGQIAHFFGHYKDLEPGKWVEIAGWDDEKKAGALIVAAIERAQAEGSRG